MKNKLLLLALFSLTPFSLFGNIDRIDPENVEKIKKDLVEFHKPTSSGQFSTKPDVSKLQNTNKLLVAKMDSFGLDRYFTLETNEDVNQLVEAVQNGGGMNVSWFYLQDPFKYDLIKITSYEI